MKTTSQYIVLFFLFFVNAVSVEAQDITRLHFEATGEQKFIDSVKIENLNRHTSITTTSVNLNLVSLSNDSVFVFADSTGYILEFQLKKSQKITISLNDDKAVRIKKTVFIKAHIPVQFYLSHLLKKEYILTVSSPLFRYSKTIKGIPLNIPVKELPQKQIQPLLTKIDTCQSISIAFHQGDILKLTGFSGYNRTLVLIDSAKSQTVAFWFADCTDADGNHYAVTDIGGQLWMVENLKTTTYQNGTSIPNKKDSLWQYGTTGAYRNIYDIDKYTNRYGRLYNWYAVSSSNKLAPKGWHIPAYDEWNKMIKAVGVNDSLRILGGVPAGYCDVNGEFGHFGTNGYWWLSSDYIGGKAWYNYLYRKTASVSLFYADKHHGFSVRCVKDK